MHFLGELEGLSARANEAQTAVEALRESLSEEDRALASARKRERLVQVKAVGLLQDECAASTLALRAKLHRCELVGQALKAERDAQATELLKRQAELGQKTEELAKLNASNARSAPISAPTVASGLAHQAAGTSGSDISTVRTPFVSAFTVQF